MSKLLPLIAAAGVLVAAAVVHGLRTDRWGRPDNLDAYTAPLTEVAWTLGDWDGEAVAMSERELAVAEAAGHLSRRYRNRRTGDEVSVIVLCGRPGPLALHTPEVCFQGAGFQLAGERQRYKPAKDVAGEPQEFWTATFAKRDRAEPESLRLFWAWSDGGPWVAPEEARLVFFHSPALYKMYVSHR